MEICRKCGKRLSENEYICQNCFNIIDLDKYEEQVDETIKEIGVLQNPPKKKYVTCKKCGGYIKIGDAKCQRCGHIINASYFESCAQLYREVAEENQIAKKSKGLQLACFFIPFIGLFMWLKYRKKDPLIASLCIDNWWMGLGRARFIPYIIIVALCVFLFGGI